MISPMLLDSALLMLMTELKLAAALVVVVDSEEDAAKQDHPEQNIPCDLNSVDIHKMDDGSRDGNSLLCFERCAAASWGIWCQVLPLSVDITTWMNVARAVILGRLLSLGVINEMRVASGVRMVWHALHWRCCGRCRQWKTTARKYVTALLLMLVRILFISKTCVVAYCDAERVMCERCQGSQHDRATNKLIAPGKNCENETTKRQAKSSPFCCRRHYYYYYYYSYYYYY
jgi:hypothetical protein